MGSSSLVKDVADNSLSDTELRLGLPGTTADAPQATTAKGAGAKRTLEEDGDKEVSHARSGEEFASPAKAQVVGWPPIRSYRRNNFQARKAEAEAAGLYVKVSMDGAPYLRKIDLKVYKGYRELRQALDDMFRCFSLGEVSKRGGPEYAMTYEDKDGDCMLVGDVPWEMFISSCRRLRIMRGSEGRGLESTQ